MKNSMRKFSALFLAVVLTLLIIPVVPIQAIENETTANPVLNVNFNGDEHYSPTMQAGGIGSDKVITSTSTDGSSLVMDFTSATGTSDVRAYYGGQTDLPLKNKIYTIDFDVKREDKDAVFFLYVDSNDGITGNNGMMLKRNGGGPTYFYTMKGTSYVTSVRIAKEIYTTEDYVVSVRLVVDAVNGQMTVMGLGNNGRYAASIMQKDVQFTDGNLYLLFKCDSDRPAKKLTVSNMKIYEGLVPNGEASLTDETDGELLLRLGDMSKATTGNYGVTYTPDIDFTRGVASAYEYDETTGVGRTVVKSNPTGSSNTITAFGGTTNLHLGTNARYTVRYQLKFVGSGGSGLMFAWPNFLQGIGVYLHPTIGAAGIFGMSTGKYVSYQSYKDEMKTDGTVFSDEGFVDVAVEIDEFLITLYINGVKLFSYDTFTDALGAQEQIGFPTDTLTLVFQNYMNPIPNGTQCEYRNVEIWSGLTVSNAWLSVTDGETKIKENERFSSTDSYVLPIANAVGYKIFKGWMINGDATNLMASGETLSMVGGGKIMVEAVYTTSQDAWVQFKENSDGTTDARIVGVLDSLDYYEIGYQVSITYNGHQYSKDKALQNAYASLSAKYGTEIVTAKSLGFSDARCLTSLVIKNVPTTGEVTIELIPYYITTEGGEKTLLEKVTLTLVDGELAN